MGDQLVIGEVNISDSFEIAGEFGIMGTPTMILFKDGEPKWRHTGFLPKGKLKDRLEENL